MLRRIAGILIPIHLHHLLHPHHLKHHRVPPDLTDQWECQDHEDQTVPKAPRAPQDFQDHPEYQDIQDHPLDHPVDQDLWDHQGQQGDKDHQGIWVLWDPPEGQEVSGNIWENEGNQSRNCKSSKRDRKPDNRKNISIKGLSSRKTLCYSNAISKQYLSVCTFKRIFLFYRNIRIFYFKAQKINLIRRGYMMHT